MSWYDDEQALTHTEVYLDEAAALQDLQHAASHGWKVAERSASQRDVSDAMARLGRLGMYPGVAAAQVRAEQQVEVTYSRTDDWLRVVARSMSVAA